MSKIYTNGNILEARMEENQEDKHNIDRIISIGVLCNDSRLDVEGKIKKEILLIELLFYMEKRILLIKIY